MNLSGYTSTELLKIINDIKNNHDLLKKEIINYTIEIEKIENYINNKIIELTKLEEKYIFLIEEISKR